MKSGDEQAYAARQVLAGTFHGVLSTHSLEQAGYPVGSGVPYVLDQDGLPLAQSFGDGPALDQAEILEGKVYSHGYDVKARGSCRRLPPQCSRGCALRGAPIGATHALAVGTHTIVR